MASSELADEADDSDKQHETFKASILVCLVIQYTLLYTMTLNLSIDSCQKKHTSHGYKFGFNDHTLIANIYTSLLFYFDYCLLISFGLCSLN